MSANVPATRLGPRGSAAVVAAAAAAVFVVLAAVTVPWQPVPGGPLTLPLAEEIFPPAHLAEVEAFSWGARLRGWSALAISLAVAAAFGFTSLGRRLMDRLPGPWWLRVAGGVVVVLLAGRFATLPLALAMRAHREEFGLTGQPVPDYLRDLAVAEALGVAVTSVVLVLLVGCARRWRRWWPAVVGGLLGVLVLLGSYVYPTLVEPLFHDFTPLPEGELRTSVLALADAQGVDVGEVLVADASRRTTTLNAYVSGLALPGVGDTRRVVLYDNLVDDLPLEQTMAVVAHELAHARRADVLVGTLLGASGVVAGVGLLGLILARRLDGVERRDDLVRSVPLILALFAVASFVSSPVESGISRQVERRADVDAVRATGDPQGFVDLQRQLSLRSLSDPTPPAWSQWWFGTHPTALERIALARRVAPNEPAD